MFIFVAASSIFVPKSFPCVVRVELKFNHLFPRIWKPCVIALGTEILQRSSLKKQQLELLSKWERISFVLMPQCISCWIFFFFLVIPLFLIFYFFYSVILCSVLSCGLILLSYSDHLSHPLILERGCLLFGYIWAHMKWWMSAGTDSVIWENFLSEHHTCPPAFLAHPLSSHSVSMLLLVVLAHTFVITTFRFILRFCHKPLPL